MESLEATQLSTPITEATQLRPPIVDLISRKDFQEGGIFFGINIPKFLPIPQKIVTYLCPDGDMNKEYNVEYNADLLHYLRRITRGLQQDVMCDCGAHILQKNPQQKTDEEMLTRLIH